MSESKHLKRSENFSLQVRRLAEKVLSGTLDAQERADLAHILRFNTTDSRCVVNAADDEPIFTLRAKDRIARQAVNYWIACSETAQLHTDKIEDARQCWREMEAYAERKAAG